MMIRSVRTVQELSLALFPDSTQSICAGGEGAGRVRHTRGDMLRQRNTLILFRI